MRKLIRMPIVGSRRRGEQLSEPDLDHSERYAARLGRILDADVTRSPSAQPPESSEDTRNERA